MKLQSIVWLLLLGIIMVPAASHAETSCPWLNNTTAAGAIGGPVGLKVQSTPAGDICLFQYQKGSTVYDLQIVVQDDNPSVKIAMPVQPRCQSQAISLKGIGNEATMCVADSSSFYGERVTGRVRDRRFAIYLGSNMRKNPAMPNEMLQIKTENIAEQVAGSLF